MGIQLSHFGMVVDMQLSTVPVCSVESTSLSPRDFLVWSCKPDPESSCPQALPDGLCEGRHRHGGANEANTKRSSWVAQRCPASSNHSHFNGMAWESGIVDVCSAPAIVWISEELQTCAHPRRMETILSQEASRGCWRDPLIDLNTFGGVSYNQIYSDIEYENWVWLQQLWFWWEIGKKVRVDFLGYVEPVSNPY